VCVAVFVLQCCFSVGISCFPYRSYIRCSACCSVCCRTFCSVCASVCVAVCVAVRVAGCIFHVCYADHIFITVSVAVCFASTCCSVCDSVYAAVCIAVHVAVFVFHVCHAQQISIVALAHICNMKIHVRDMTHSNVQREVLQCVLQYVL